VGVAHGHLDGRVAHQLLDDLERNAPHGEVATIGVPQVVPCMHPCSRVMPARLSAGSGPQECPATRCRRIRPARHEEESPGGDKRTPALLVLRLLTIMKSSAWRRPMHGGSSD
jgi:hypothetical protein